MTSLATIIKALDAAQIHIVFLVAGGLAMFLGTVRLKRFPMRTTDRIVWQIVGWAFLGLMMAILILGMVTK